MAQYLMTYFNRYSLVVVLCLIQLPAFAEDNNKEYKSLDKSLDKYWETFRSAALNRDYDVIASLTKFPVSIHGTLDDDPVIEMNQQLFIKNLNIFLTQDTGLSLTDKSETELDLFKRTIKIKDEGGFSRLGDFVFQLIENRWLLVRVYSDLDDVK